MSRAYAFNACLIFVEQYRETLTKKINDYYLNIFENTEDDFDGVRLAAADVE